MRNMVYVFVLAMGLLTACNWSSENSKEKVFVSMNTANDANSSISDLDKINLYIFNEAGKLAEKHIVKSSEIIAGNYKLNLLPGNYSVWGIANVDEENISLTAPTPDKNKIMWTKRDSRLLPWFKGDNAYQGVYDLLTAHSDCQVTSDKAANINLTFVRRVSKAKISLSKIPSGIKNIDIQLSGTPKGISFDGSHLEANAGICGVTHFNESSASADADVYFLPPADPKTPVSIEVYYEDADKIVRKSVVALEGPVVSNTIFNIEISFGVLQEVYVGCVISDWGETLTIKKENIIGGGDIIVEDHREVVGNVSSQNLLENGNFEYWEGNMPSGWKFMEGKAGLLDKVGTESAKEGNSAVMLGGGTYFAKDVEVEERAAYQLKFFAKCNFDLFEWKCCCSWMKTPSTMLGAVYNDEIQTVDKMGRTEGWIDIFNSKNVRAPIGAKFLRIEFRCYSEPVENVGLLLDELSVFKIIE